MRNGGRDQLEALGGSAMRRWSALRPRCVVAMARDHRDVATVQEAFTVLKNTHCVFFNPTGAGIGSG